MKLRRGSDRLGEDTAVSSTTWVSYDQATGVHVADDGTSWLTRTIPLYSMEDTGLTGRLRGGQELTDALVEVGRTSRSMPGNRRRLSKEHYRDVHILVVDVPHPIRVPEGTPERQAAELGPFLARKKSSSRICTVSVRLRSLNPVGSSLERVVENYFDRRVRQESIAAPAIDYSADIRTIDSALRRAAGRPMTAEEARNVHGWWNHGRWTDSTNIPHSNHIHVFSEGDELRRIQEMVDEGDATWESCVGWPRTFTPGDHHAIAFGSIVDFGYSSGSTTFDPDSVVRPVTHPSVQWIPPLFRNGALAVSLRFLIEPGAVTVHELERLKDHVDDEIDKHVNRGRALQDRRTQMRTAMGTAAQHFSNTMEPSLAFVSGIVAMPLDPEAANTWNDGFTGWEEIGANVGLTLRPLPFGQMAALSETQICSRVRSAPRKHDLDVRRIGYTGAQSCAEVGDGRGIFIGRGVTDDQPVWLDLDQGFKDDALPFIGIVGATGAGKLATLDTRIPTPTGWTTMGDLVVGDLVIDRHGAPCAVTFVTEIDEAPELYDVYLDDGQVIRVCVDHQWVVSDGTDRHGHKTPGRRAAISRWERIRQGIRDLETLAQTFGSEHESSASDLADLLADHVPSLADRWAESNRAHIISHQLAFIGCPVQQRRGECQVTHTSNIIKTDPVKLWPTRSTIEALRKFWLAALRRGGGNATRWGEQLRSKAAAATFLLNTDLPNQATIRGIARMLHGAGASRIEYGHAATAARRYGIEPVNGQADVCIPLAGTNTPKGYIENVYPTAIALKALARRLDQQAGERPNGENATEQVLTTGDMLNVGVTSSSSRRARFAIRVAGSLVLPEAEVPIDPYVLGAWLGDGDSAAGQFTAGTSEACTDGDGQTDQSHLRRQLETAGYPTIANGNRVGARGLQTPLRALGLLRNKHIPPEYLRASTSQRLALLQGLMDTDGYIDKRGRCELALSDRTLATNAIELIRSLGIKACETTGPAGYRDENGEHVVCKDRHRIKFTTKLAVFRLPRKLARLPQKVRDTANWHYITKISPVLTQPGRCITVDSPDSTYLIGQFVPTHNTQLLYSMATQRLCQGFPVLLCDFKVNNKNTRYVNSVRRMGIPATQASFDELSDSDGVLDPFRFATRATAPGYALNFLTQVDIWAETPPPPLWQTRLEKGLKAAADDGARCVGEALRMMAKNDPSMKEITEPLIDYAETQPMFRLGVGLDPRGEPLRVDNGLTVFEVGDAAIAVPPPGSDVNRLRLPQRLAVAVIDLQLKGGLAALKGRRGLFEVDEGWAPLGANPEEFKNTLRQARSLAVTVALGSQLWSDIRLAVSFMTRAIVGRLDDKSEAGAALTDLEVDADLRTILEMRTFSAQFNEDRTEVLRGSLWWVRDLARRLGLVESMIPDHWLSANSTNVYDVEMAERAEAAASAHPEEAPA